MCCSRDVVSNCALREWGRIGGKQVIRHNMEQNASNIKEVTERIERAIKDLVARYAQEKFWVTHYGANDIDPKYLVYWICVESDEEKKRLSDDNDLERRLRTLLIEHAYPVSGRDEVHIGFESQQTVDRESGGNWWHHWK